MYVRAYKIGQKKGVKQVGATAENNELVGKLMATLRKFSITSTNLIYFENKP